MFFEVLGLTYHRPAGLYSREITHNTIEERVLWTPNGA
jgi:hypothetical protein